MISLGWVFVPMNVDIRQNGHVQDDTKSNEQILTEQILQYDDARNYEAVLKTIRDGDHLQSHKLYCLIQLAIGGRFQSAYIVAKTLAEAGVDNPVIDLIRCLGAAIFGSAADFAQATSGLGHSIGRLNPDQLHYFCGTVAPAVLSRVHADIVPNADDGLRKTIASVHRMVLDGAASQSVGDARDGSEPSPKKLAKKPGEKKKAAAKRLKPMVEKRYRLDSDSAWQNISTKNPHGKWFIARRKQESATKRLGSRIVLPEFHPAFTIGLDEPIFCVGNCYTHSFEAALMSLGFKIPSWFVYGSNDLMNRYNNFAVLNEFRWALEPERYPFPTECFITEGDLVVDPTMYLTMLPRDQVLALRQSMTETFARVRESKVVFLFLGQTEAWFDKKAGIYLTEPPTFAACRAEPDRYEVRITGYEENYKAIEEIYSLLSKHCGPDFRMVLTSSPTPVITTFTDNDVLVSNIRSKAMLRTVADEFARGHDNVDYYPSYETITYSDRSVTWESDRQHVTPDLVTADALHFAVHYLPTDEAEPFRQKLGQLQQRYGAMDGEAAANETTQERRRPPSWKSRIRNRFPRVYLGSSRPAPCRRSMDRKTLAAVRSKFGFQNSGLPIPRRC